MQHHKAFIITFLTSVALVYGIYKTTDNFGYNEVVSNHKIARVGNINPFSKLASAITSFGVPLSTSLPECADDAYKAIVVAEEVTARNTLLQAERDRSNASAEETNARIAVTNAEKSSSKKVTARDKAQIARDKALETLKTKTEAREKAEVARDQAKASLDEASKPREERLCQGPAPALGQPDNRVCSTKIVQPTAASLKIPKATLAKAEKTLKSAITAEKTAQSALDKAEKALTKAGSTLSDLDSLKEEAKQALEKLSQARETENQARQAYDQIAYRLDWANTHTCSDAPKPQTPQTPNTTTTRSIFEASCTDGRDNDADGLFDCADTDCQEGGYAGAGDWCSQSDGYCPDIDGPDCTDVDCVATNPTCQDSTPGGPNDPGTGTLNNGRDPMQNAGVCCACVYNPNEKDKSCGASLDACADWLENQLSSGACDTSLGIVSIFSIWGGNDLAIRPESHQMCESLNIAGYHHGFPGYVNVPFDSCTALESCVEDGGDITYNSMACRMFAHESMADALARELDRNNVHYYRYSITANQACDLYKKDHNLYDGNSAPFSSSQLSYFVCPEDKYKFYDDCKPAGTDCGFGIAKCMDGDTVTSQECCGASATGVGTWSEPNGGCD